MERRKTRDANIADRKEEKNLTFKPAVRKTVVVQRGAGQGSPAEDSFGVISSIRDGFGFIQPFLCEEQAYFPTRELPPNARVNDEVCYREKRGPKGLNADGIRLIDRSKLHSVGKFKGVVSREADSHRLLWGLISVDNANSLPQKVPFLLMESESKVRPVMRGDEVEFTALQLPGSSYFVAKEISVTKTKKEKLLDGQIQRMLDAGAVREFGIIHTIRGEYGFINALDQHEQIYFRVADMVENDIAAREGLEVSFFVVMESSKGRLSPRAVHLRPVADGTVQYEVTLAENVEAIVITEPQLPRSGGGSSVELPGMIALKSEASMKVLSGLIGKEDFSSKSVKNVELWGRCLPEGMVLKAGDVIRLDVQFYRPQKLVFARDVKVCRYRQLGRELGTICSLRERGGFGFIKSIFRDTDLYFRPVEVFDENGDLAEQKLTEQSPVSFDVCLDSSGSGKLRASRVTFLNSSETDPGICALAAKMTGVVTKAAKKDAPGSIRMFAMETKNLYPSDLLQGFKFFDETPQLKELTLEFLPTSQRMLYHRCLDECFPLLAHQSIDSTKDAKCRAFRLWKCNDATEFDSWKTSKTVEDNASDLASQEKLVNFLKSDVVDDLGQVSKDLKVNFDLFFERKSNSLVAKRVCLTDEDIDGCSGNFNGIVETITSGARTHRFGFVRLIPLDEKLFWQGNGSSSDSMLQEGSEVSFEIRCRGGIRCAVNLVALTAGALNVEEELEGMCSAVRVDENHVVLVDCSSCPTLARKYWSALNLDRLSLLTEMASKGMSLVSDDPMGNKMCSADSSKYFSSLARLPVPIRSEENCPSEVGDFVICSVIANWGVQRHPVGARLLRHQEGSSKLLRQLGSIKKTQIRHLDCEVCEVESCSDKKSFFCCEKDVVKHTPTAAIEIGDAIEFFGITEGSFSLLAIGATTQGKLDDNAAFRRSGVVNANLKEMQQKSGFKGISMAQGPPDNSEFTGFPKNWREPVDLKGLPWQHLLVPPSSLLDDNHQLNIAQK